MNFELLKKEKVTIENVTFTIKKLNAVDALDVLEEIRFELAKISDNIKTSSSEMKDFIKAIASLPPSFMKELRKKLFSNVHFTKKGEISGQGAGPTLTEEMWNMAFERCEASDIYELTLRCLVINFFYSFEKAKKFLKEVGVLSSLNPQQQ